MKDKIPATKAMLIMESWGKGGTETYVAGLTQMLVRMGIDVSLVLLHKGDEAKVDFLPSSKVFVTGLTGLVGVLRHVRPDVLSLHLYTSMLPAAAIGRFFRVPVVSTLHIPLSSWGIRHRIYWRLSAKLSSTVVGVSRMIVDELRQRNMFERPLPGGVDKRFFSVVRPGKSSQGDFGILAMGRLEYQKDWPTLIEAIALLSSSKRERLIVNFFGSGSLQTALAALASKHDVRAVFHGYADKSTLVSALAVANLCVLPSRFEGLGLSALEGMAAGVPTITADFAAANDFIEHGITGHVFPVGNAHALAQLIEWHIDNSADSESIGSAGAKFVQQHFSEAVTYLPYLEIFKQVPR